MSLVGGRFLLALEFFLFVVGLEATMTELGRSVDELEVERALFQRRSRSHWRQRFSECQHSFLGPTVAPLIMRKSSSTIPNRGNPPRGVMRLFSVKSAGVVPELGFLPDATR